MFWCLGGAVAKNYREKSVDVVCYDELSSFEPDVEKEGSPTLLGDKRIEGSVWPKSIRGSTPKVKGSCQIEKGQMNRRILCVFMYRVRTVAKNGTLNSVMQYAVRSEMGEKQAGDGVLPL